jgi:transposase
VGRGSGAPRLPVQGVGAIVALAFLLTIDKRERFAKSRTVGSFLGLTPRKHQSGRSDPELRITKTGDAFVRRLLVNSAQYILGTHAQDSDLRRWGLALASRGRKSAKNKAVVAVARKLAVLLHRLWVTGSRYQPIGYTASMSRVA